MRVLLFSIGVLSVVFGVVGIFLPLLPTTPFLLLAAWCFYKSSPRAHAWIMSHPQIGPSIRSWQERGAIPLRTKLIALSMMVFSIVVIWLRVQNDYVKYGVSVLLVCVATFIVTRPSK